MTPSPLDEHKLVNRRGLLKTVAKCGLGLAFLNMSPLSAFASQNHHRLKMYCPDTGEFFNEVMIIDHQWVDGSINLFSKFARDWHADRYRPFDPRVVLTALQIQFLLNSNEPLNVNSGYRTKTTNKKTPGAAKNSLHIEAMALDLHQPDRSTTQLRKAASSLQSGGVGYYPKRHFVHVDCGEIRQWTL